MIFCLELFGLFVTATPQSHLIEHRPETNFPRQRQRSASVQPVKKL